MIGRLEDSQSTPHIRTRDLGTFPFLITSFDGATPVCIICDTRNIPREIDTRKPTIPRIMGPCLRSFGDATRKFVFIMILP